MGLIDFITGGPKKDPVHLTDENFKDLVVNGTTPWVIDFWGPNCSWCDKMVPTIRILSARYENRVGFGEVDISRNPKITSALSVRSTPTLAFLKDGKLVERLVGYHPEQFIEEVIEAHFTGYGITTPKS